MPIEPCQKSNTAGYSGLKSARSFSCTVWLFAADHHRHVVLDRDDETAVAEVDAVTVMIGEDDEARQVDVDLVRIGGFSRRRLRIVGERMVDLIEQAEIVEPVLTHIEAEHQPAVRGEEAHDIADAVEAHVTGLDDGVAVCE